MTLTLPTNSVCLWCMRDFYLQYYIFGMAVLCAAAIPMLVEWRDFVLMLYWCDGRDSGMSRYMRLKPRQKY